MLKKPFKILAVLSLFLMILLSSCGGDYQKIRKSTDTQAKYNAAVAYYKAGSYIKALPLFDELLSIYREQKKPRI